MADTRVFKLQGLDRLREVGVFSFDVNHVADIESRVGDLDDADVEFRVIVSNSTDQFFFYCGGHGTPPQSVSSLNLSVENPLLDMLLGVAGAIPTAGGLIIPHAKGNDLSRVRMAAEKLYAYTAGLLV
jgi:hypothetical protein